MYFFSKKYIQINNNTKNITRAGIDIDPLTFRLLPDFHLEIKSSSLDVSMEASS